mmetsp:Transcript_9772/g.22346  ORF Transcript_9772/g.22346 Transcript_9772/m.22346 type:complete len:259 (-) Transcript_9772:482-1258(-)
MAASGPSPWQGSFCGGGGQEAAKGGEREPCVVDSPGPGCAIKGGAAKHEASQARGVAGLLACPRPLIAEKGHDVGFAQESPRRKRGQARRPRRQLGERHAVEKRVRQELSPPVAPVPAGFFPPSRAAASPASTKVARRSVHSTHSIHSAVRVCGAHRGDRRVRNLHPHGPQPVNQLLLCAAQEEIDLVLQPLPPHLALGQASSHGGARHARHPGPSPALSARRCRRPGVARSGFVAPALGKVPGKILRGRGPRIGGQH